MAASSHTPGDRRSLDATVDDYLPGRGLNGGASDSLSSGSLVDDDGVRMALVEGSGPELTSDTHSVLATRLRAAAIVLFAGFAVFLVWGYIGPAYDDAEGLKFELLHWFHWVVTIALAGASLQLCTKCPKTLRYLRGYELVVFGLPAAFFLTMQVMQISACIDAGALTALSGSVARVPVFWVVLIYTYSMFIPNSWKRAALVVSLMAAAPLVVKLAVQLQAGGGGPFLSWAAVAEMLLVTGIAAAAGAYGTYIIGALRREAFAAKQLGQYHLKQLLGTGGMGEVYLAEHQLLKRPCAIKLIRPEKAGDPKALARFEREVRATARLSHWNTVEIFDYGHADDGTFYYVMEYLPGLNLAQVVTRHGPMPAERVVHLLRQACAGLREAHRAGLIHRDIKPGNIFAAERGGLQDVAKVLDFGLVKPTLKAEESGSEPMDLTVDGSIAGSPLYMSPEQALGEEQPDARSDVYSLGAVAYYLLTGHAPFEADKPLKVIYAHQHEAVVPPSALCADVPEDLERVVLKCLEKAPEDRYESAEALGEALAEVAAADRWDNEDASRWWREVRVAETAETPQMAAVS